MSVSRSVWVCPDCGKDFLVTFDRQKFDDEQIAHCVLCKKDVKVVYTYHSRKKKKWVSENEIVEIRKSVNQYGKRKGVGA